MPFADRTIRIYFNPDDLVFDSDAKLEAFQMALGRQVMYGLRTHKDYDTSLSSISIERDREITAVHFSAIPRYAPEERYSNTPNCRIDNAVGVIVDEFKDRPKFVLGAVPRDGGKTYSFHS